MKTTVNKDGSITTSTDDEHDTVPGPVLSTAKISGSPKASPAETKVVAPEDAPAEPKTRSRASSK